MRPTLLALSVLLMFVGCNKQPPVPQPPTFELEDYAGTWLRTDKAVAFIAHDPTPRVLVFRTLNGTSPILTPDHPYGGIRTCVLDPYQTKNWNRASSQPAQVTGATGHSVRVVAAPDEESHLQNILDVSLGESEGGLPQLTILHHLVNTSDEARELAPWSITSIPNGGTLTANYARAFGTENGEPRLVRRVGFFNGADPRNPSFLYGKNDFTLDTAVPQEGNSKVMLFAPDGTVTYRGRDGVVFTSTGPSDPGNYPEGGFNVTFYRNWSPQDLQWHYTELEHVGTLREVGPGDEAVLKQVITLGEPLLTPATTKPAE